MKTVCAKHQEAYEVGKCCPWCEPEPAQSLPATNACDPLMRLRRMGEDGSCDWNNYAPLHRLISYKLISDANAHVIMDRLVILHEKKRVLDGLASDRWPTWVSGTVKAC